MRQEFDRSNPRDERNGRIEADGLADGSGATGHDVRLNRVDVNFFRVFEVPVLAGRAFEQADTTDAATGSEDCPAAK